MNYQLAFVFTLLVAFATAAPGSSEDECKAKREAAQNKCKAELSATDADIAAWMKKPPYPDSLNDCLVKCVAEKLEMFKDGKVVESKVMHIINKKNSPNKDKEIQLFNQCKTPVIKPNMTDCDTAGAIYTCVMEGAVKMGLVM